MESKDQKNLIIAIALSVLVFVGWGYLFPQPTVDPSIPQQQPNAQKEILNPLAGTSGNASVAVPAVHGLTASQEKRISIETPKLSGSIRLQGARLDDLVLKEYKQTTDQNSPKVKLLIPASQKDSYFAEFGWTTADSSITMPTAETLWTVEGSGKLTIDQPVVLTYTNPQGIAFKRTISVDKDYVFAISDQIQNTSAKPLSVAPYGRVNRAFFKAKETFYILNEGAVGYFSEDKDEERTFEKMVDEPAKSFKSQGGWFGLTDKYWLAALIPDQKNQLEATYRFVQEGADKSFQVDFLGQVQQVNAGATLNVTQHLFAGPKILNLLDSYETTLGIKHFDLAVDFGIFYIITKPIFLLLVMLKDWVGSFGIAILLFTVALKLVFFPLANKSYRSMAHMRAMQPQMEKIRTLYADDKLRMNQEIMALYQKERVNPMAGCLPMLLQIPVFFALYKVLFVTIEMRQAPFFGWIHDLSAPDPTTLFNLFGVFSFTPPSFLMIGAWPLIMGATMLIQQKLSPPPADPAQAKMFMLMPVLFTFMLANFPVGLVIYWAWNNVLTILQQVTIMRMETARMKAKK